jgi:outer membrane protein TolC
VSFPENLLKNLITDRYESWYGTGIQPADKLLAMAQTYDLVDSWTQALMKRPDFRQIRTELEKQGLYVKLSFNQLFPSLDLVGGYGLTGVSDSQYTPVVSPLGQVSWNQTYKSSLGDAWGQVTDVRNPRHSFGAVLSLPLSRQAERNRYKQSKITLKQVELQVRQAHQNILVEVDNAISQAKINFERVSATREARVYAEAALEAEQKKLEAGTTTMFEVLRLQRDLTATRSEEVRALADFNESMASLYFAEGTLLERYKISLDFK